mgnify:CR=1 FL=1
MTARLVATGGLPRGGAPWSVVLSSCGAQQAFMRSQRGLLSDDRAAAFLVLDREFPRSVFFALSEAERRLDALSPQEDRIGISDEAQRQLGRIRTSLEYRSTSDVIADLPAQMLRVQGSVMAASQAGAARDCLFNTSDAADEGSRGDLGGRRILKKKKRNNSRMAMS